MSKDASQFVNVCPVFLSEDVKKTVDFYTEKLGFQSAKHFDTSENFATLYRDEIEFVIVQAKQVSSLINSYRAKSHKVVSVRLLHSVISRQAAREKGNAS